MRQTGIACAGALLVALMAVGARDRPEVGGTTAPAAPASAAPSTPAAHLPPPPTMAGAPEAAVVDAVPEEAPRPRRYRRRRNIYPGPIPTPAEWQAPEGPVRIALQAGHWRADEAPDELRGLRDNGTSSRGKAEWEVNLEIARRAATMLEARGYLVDVLPAVVPPSYRAHLFISIHADGSNDPRATGFRVASPRQDATGRASRIAGLLERSYAEATGIRRLPDVTRRMSNYYAFNFRRYVHALHPMTIAVILETGFLTSGSDWDIIVDQPDRAARGIVAAVTEFDLTPPPASAEIASEQLD